MRRQSLSALIAATAVIGLPTANAIAALTASPPSSSSTKGKAKAAAAKAGKAKPAAAKAAQAKAAAAPKPAATTTVGATPTVTAITTEAGVINLGPPLDLMPTSTVAKPSAPATEWTYVGDTVEMDIQSAKLDLIAGATRASFASAASLQSATDKADIRL